MKKVVMFLFAALFGAVLTLSATPPDKSWFTDFKKAEAEAKAKNLPMFLLFTGSDWCPWCMKLHKDTLDTSKFKAFVKAKVVLVYLDFPRKTKLPEAVVKQNQALMNQYGVQGFPTVIVTEPDGRKIGELGYAKVDQFLPRLQKVLDGRKAAPKVAAVAATEKKEEGGFLTDFAQAQKLAAEKKQPIVALFTGSDWCPWCIKLHKETLGTKEFKEFIAKDAVFVYLDFPNRVKLPEALKKQNDGLSSKYKVEGFPTTLVIGADGKELGRVVGFRAAADYVKTLKSFAKK